jgi:hypothetical protein
VKGGLEHRLILRATIGKRLTERPDESQTSRSPKIVYANNVEQNEPAMLLPYAAAQRPKKMRLARAGGAIDDAANRAIGIGGIETREITQDTFHMIVI